MSTTRRDFVKTMAASGVGLAASDLVATLLAQSPKGGTTAVRGSLVTITVAKAPPPPTTSAPPVSPTPATT